MSESLRGESNRIDAVRPRRLRGHLPGGAASWLVASALLVTGNAFAADAFEIAPTRLDFGKVALGTSSLQQVVNIKNTSTSALVVQPGGGGTSLFDATQNCANATLAPGQACQFFFSLTPQTLGPITEQSIGQLFGVPPGGGAPTPAQSFTIDLSGVGVPPGEAPPLPFAIAPTRLDFGNVPLGITSAEKVVTITNATASPVVLELSGGATNLFGGGQNCQGTTLAPGRSCQLSFAFTPNALGPVQETTTGVVNLQPFKIELTGTGVAAPAAPLPFAAFTVQLLAVRPSQNAFSVTTFLRLGAGSNGVDPSSEPVTLVAGHYSATIPPGSFTRRRDGTFTFSSRELTAVIFRRGGAQFFFSALVDGAVPGVSPADVSLTLGDDGGNTVSVQPLIIRR